MTKGCAPTPEAPRRQAKPTTSKPAVDASKFRSNGYGTFRPWKLHVVNKDRNTSILSIVIVAILAAVGGATGWKDIELYALSHESWLETFLDLANEIPSADTYRRMFERLGSGKYVVIN